MRTADLDDVEAVLGANFVLHAGQMILHDSLGEAEAIGDFFVYETLGDEGNDLLFAAGELGRDIGAVSCGKCGE